jgi:hypothetical protein
MDMAFIWDREKNLNWTWNFNRKKNFESVWKSIFSKYACVFQVLSNLRFLQNTTLFRSSFFIFDKFKLRIFSPFFTPRPLKKKTFYVLLKHFSWAFLFPHFFPFSKSAIISKLFCCLFVHLWWQLFPSLDYNPWRNHKRIFLLLTWVHVLVVMVFYGFIM